jgi:hypothetical protein
MRIKQIITEAIKTADAEKLQQLRQSLQAQQQAKLQQDMDAWAQDFAANNRSRTVATDTQAQQNNPFAQQQSAPTRTRPANRMGSRKVMSRKQKITELIRKGSAFIKWADKYKDALPPNLQAQLENIENAWTDRLENPDASPETESDYDTLLELYRKFYGDMLEYHNMKRATKKAKPSQIRRQQMKPSKAVVTKFNEEEIDTSVNETIRKIDAHHWRLYSGKGKNLGTFDSLGAAKKHEGEVQYFKHVKEGDVVSLKTGKKVVPQAVSIRQAFGSEMANSIEDMGVRFAEKPSYWEDLEDGGAYGDRAVNEVKLMGIQKQLGHRLNTYTTADIYGSDPKSPQSNVKNMPEESVFIVQFKNGKRYLCNKDGSRTYIRNWTAIKQA